jgi:protein-L-isoaspartate O-methyltransferase
MVPAIDVRPGPVPEEAATEWADAFRAVPRAVFLPERVWPFRDGRAQPAVDRATDPEGWLRAAQGGEPVITQWDDGRHDGPEPGTTATSSASQPGLVAKMLALLDVRPGMRVLEVGTGTGWNAGLLAHRLGDDSVVSVEVDPHVAEQARQALDRAGLHPEVVTGDGAAGAPHRAPFDRLIVTAGVREIPPAWLRQVRAGGIILLPWGTPYTHADALVRLGVGPDGTATGRLRGLVEFMKLRDQRRAHPRMAADLTCRDYESEAWPPAGQWEPWCFIAGLLLREATYAVQQHDDRQSTQWLWDLGGTTWCAAVRADDPPRTMVRQAGPRPLWDELTAAYAWWQSQGEPGLDRFGLSVSRDGRTTVWLDDPARPVPSVH